MKTKLDIKSALIGLLLGIVASVAIAGTASHGMVLDTATGQVWTTFLSSDGGRTDADFRSNKLEPKK